MLESIKCSKVTFARKRNISLKTNNHGNLYHAISCIQEHEIKAQLHIMTPSFGWANELKIDFISCFKMNNGYSL